MYLSWSDSSEGVGQMQVKFASCDKSMNDANNIRKSHKSLDCSNLYVIIIIAEMASSNATIFRWKIKPSPVDFKRLY